MNNHQQEPAPPEFINNNPHESAAWRRWFRKKATNFLDAQGLFLYNFLPNEMQKEIFKGRSVPGSFLLPVREKAFFWPDRPGLTWW